MRGTELSLDVVMIIDCFTYNGERDILEIRLNVLKDCVDQFIIVEASTTFSGLVKPLYYEQHKERFKEFWPKIKYFAIDENYTPEEIALAESSPNTQGAAHWKHEFLQKESILKALYDARLNSNDICFVGDVDEIWEPNIDWLANMGPLKLKLRVYSYWLNNRSSEEFYGPIVGLYGKIRGECLNHLRQNAPRFSQNCGWHFTSMGGYEEVRRKLESSYTEESYWTPWVQTNLEENIKRNRDFLGRNFTYRKDESEWPEYLKNNKEKYAYLCLQ